MWKKIATFRSVYQSVDARIQVADVRRELFFEQHTFNAEFVAVERKGLEFFLHIEDVEVETKTHFGTSNNCSKNRSALPSLALSPSNVFNISSSSTSGKILSRPRSFSAPMSS